MSEKKFGEGMDSEGRFYEVEKDGKLIMLYYHPKYHPIPQIESSTPSDKATCDNQLLYLCPIPRWQTQPFDYEETTLLHSSPEYPKTQPDDSDHHHVLPLSWCNNEEFDVNGGCEVCRGSKFGTDYYFCEDKDEKYHKECVESPLRIRHPHHPEHALQLCFYNKKSLKNECLLCGRKAKYLVYCCMICEAFMHTVCAMKQIDFVIDHPKRHDHPLFFFPRQTSLTCNICGWLRKIYPTYVCLRCNFVAHKDCLDSPHVIKISRHRHRISYNVSLQDGEWSCGVCRKGIDSNYGGYTCNKCVDYVVHSRCALAKDVYDGVELEGVQEEDDIKQDTRPFNMISEGVILHFLHDHHLRLEANICFDENKFCQACALPIFEGNLYTCMECTFIIHETCANAPRRVQHALHPHPLILKAECGYSSGSYFCNGCDRDCGGFVYQCPIKECEFDLDIWCASISEPFHYRDHEHPLFLALDSKEKPTCQVCKRECLRQLNCIQCDFIVCIKCATMPYKARYKHDSHVLTIVCGEEVSEKDLCEVCELDKNYTDLKMFYYWCQECGTLFHVECLFGEDPYLKIGQTFYLLDQPVQILGTSNVSRPLRCDRCSKPCQRKTYKSVYGIGCSVRCLLILF